MIDGAFDHAFRPEGQTTKDTRREISLNVVSKIGQPAVKGALVYASDDSSLKQDPKAPLNVVVKRFIFLWDLKSHEHPLPIRTSGIDRIWLFRSATR
jgi:hypothetical protein